mmetsp:Transcript_440/g.1313  ORF Transcript_440/g.1313 Transcript_440/m.1313 type:complete len:197 (+) Transcript_440:38-628(+)|eukprot:CAMPEP_0206137478 /NCGR_PEP_ID=MMETSP1473-20131121/2596_1 /ASSEMBLY_ACC=CAM_ASM_001109 /TAXON_ID=1461547 /ORGANISM="Stichococcus sp, Strain RCC1054" /LENGTH=196 /DNA_ID=CAMNT_0053530587 /DNA_START=38 /DNA_END=628 /DNA_ORIENTATION=-
MLSLRASSTFIKPAATFRARTRPTRASRSIFQFRAMAAKVGDSIPAVTLYEGSPGNEVKLQDVFKGKKGILFGVPGAFTPGCSKTHLPGYINDYEKLKAAGAEVVVCTAVNDAFVTGAWGEAAGADGKVRILADPHGELAKGLGVVLEKAEVFGQNRSKRYSAVIEDNKIKNLNVEEDGTGLSCSLSNVVLDQLKA